MTTHILILIPSAQYEAMTDAVQGALTDLVRRFLIDQAADPIHGITMRRGDALVIVASYWREHVNADLTPEAVVGLNAMLAAYGIEVVPCDDPAAALSERGITAKQEGSP